MDIQNNLRKFSRFTQKFIFWILVFYMVVRLMRSFSFLRAFLDQNFFYSNEFKILGFILFLLIILLCIWNGRFSKSAIRWTARIVLGLALACFFLAIVLNILERLNYPNYVLANFDIYYQNLFPISVVGLISFCFYKWQDFAAFLSRYETKQQRDLIGEGAALGIVILLVFYLISSVYSIYSDAFSRDVYVFTHLQDNYDQKMHYNWNFFYDYMRFVKEQTPQNAIVVIPPTQDAWLSSGNDVLVRYFLYPRKIIQGQLDSLPKQKYNYLLLDKGEWNVADDLYGWPRVAVDSEEIIYFDQSTEKVSQYFGNYNPNVNDNKMKWGVIKVKE